MNWHWLARMSQWVRNPPSPQRVKLFLAILAGILILLNVLAASLPSARIDLTRTGMFSLAPGSERLAANLTDQDMQDIAAWYASQTVQPGVADRRRLLRQLAGEMKLSLLHELVRIIAVQ